MKNKKLIYLLLCFVLALLLSIPIIFISSSLIHEFGHMREAKKQGLDFQIKINPPKSLSDSKNTVWGEAIPSNSSVCEKFNSLQIYNKKKIIHAGVYYELTFTLTMALIVSVLLFNSYKKYEINYSCLIFIAILIILIGMAVNTIWTNIISSNPLNDWHRLFLDC